MVTKVASDLEIIVMNWLDKRGIVYEFQTSLMGGLFELGGAVVDFILPEEMLALRVFGQYWHQSIVKQGTDQIQKEMLEADGWIVVDLWQEDIEDRLEETMRLAIRGEQVLK